MSIRAKLILALLLFAAVPMIAMGALSFGNARKSLEESRVAGLESTADLKAVKIEEFMRGLETEMRVTQDYFNIKTNLPIVSGLADDTTNPAYMVAKKVLDDQLTTLQTAKQFLDIMLVNPEGTVVYSSNEGHASPHVGGSLPGPGNKAFDEGKRGIYLGDIFQTEVFPNRFAMLVSAPLLGPGGNFIGVAALEIDMDPLYEFVQETTGLGETGETLIAARTVGPDAREGALFLNPLRHDPEAALSRIAVFGEREAVPIQEALRGRRGSGQSVDYRGEKVVAAWRPIPSADWGMVAKIDASEAFESVTSLRDVGLILGGAFLLLSVLVAGAISRAIVRPIRSLEEGARVIGGGDLDHRVGTQARDEVGRLSRAFDQMTSNLQRITAWRDELDREIRSRRQAEEALQESERRYRDLYEGAPISYFSVDADGRILSANRQAVELLGYTERELIGRPVLDVYADTTAGKGRARELLEQFLVGEPIRSAELEFRKVDGQHLWGSLSVDPTLDAEGKILESRSMMVDITERRRADEALRESEERFRKVFEESPVGICLANDEFRFVEANKAFCEMLGYTEEELVGVAMVDVTHPDDVEVNKELLIKLLSGEVPGFWMEKRYITKDRRIIWATATGGAIRDKTGKHVYTLGMIENITERKRAEEQQAALTAELEVKNAELEQFTYTVSHDLKSPLITVKGFLGLLAQDAAAGDAERMRADMARISDAAEKMSRLLDDLLELSRIGRVIGPPEEVRLGEVAGEAVALVAGQAAERDAQVTVAEDLPVVYGDRQRIREVLQNLLDNAIKFMGEQPNPRVEIGGWQDGEAPVCFVRDNGMGIDPRYSRKVFELFDQLDQKADGTGIGLALVRRIVEVHGGRVWVESDGAGHGSTFYFTLPSKEGARDHEGVRNAR